MVEERLCRRFLAFAAIRIIAKLFSISLICAHISTEEKDDVSKMVFNEHFLVTLTPRWAKKITSA